MTIGRRPTVAAVAVAVVLLAACSSDPGTNPPAAEETPTPTVVTPSRWTPVPPDSEGALPAGRYGLTANGVRGMPWAVVELDGAFSSVGEWLIHDTRSGTGGMGYWTVTGVYRDPCDTAAGLIDVGAHAKDLAAALGQQKRSRVTEPVPVTLDGYDGFYLELQAPPDLNFTDCPYDVWDSTPGGGRYLQEPGQVDRIWIVDVEDDTIVFHATAWAGAEKTALEQLTDMVESVDFVPRT